MPLYITEYDLQPIDANSRVIPIGTEPAVAYQTVTISGASTQSAVLNARTRFVRIHTDAICSIKIGTNPTAVTTETRLAANQTEFFGVRGEGTMRIAVISNT
jgi:hypothetical protein